MALKNTYSRAPAAQSVKEIQEALVKAGASGMLFEYEKGTGRIEALKFILPVGSNKVGFALPVNWRRFQAVIEQEGIGKSSDEDYVYRVAWRCLRDWVLAQLALYETQIVELPQIFLPFAVGKDNQTLYEKVIQGKFLLGSGE